MNDHIKNYLDKYLDFKCPGFAVMLKGEWGCGKTYFINDYMRILDARKRNYSYVSLNGVCSSDDIVASLLLKENWKKYGCKFLNRVCNVLSFGAYGFSFSLRNILKAEDFKSFLKDTILIFDDFERCKINQVELLGLISGFVELQHLHVIIITDESRIEEKDNYWIRKEKVVGATLELESSVSEVIPEIIENLQFDLLKKFLLEHQKLLLGVCESILDYCDKKQFNYRILKHALREFEFIFRPVLEDRKIGPHKTKIFDELFFRYLSVFYSLQAGKIKEEDLKKLLEFPYGAKEDSNYSAFRKYFPQWGGFDSFIPLNVWLDIFASKKINHQELLIHIQERFNPQVPAWKRLWYYLDYNDSELSSIYDEILQVLKKKEYRTPISILHTFTTLLELADLNFIDKTCEEVCHDAQEYLNGLGNDIEWDNSKGDINLIFDYPAGYSLRGRGLPQFEKIKNYLKERLQIKVRLNLKQRYKEFVALVRAGKFISQELMDEKYLHEDIFSGNNPDLLWDKAKKLYPKEFGDFCRVCVQALIPQYLDRFEMSQNFKDFWEKMLALSRNFLKVHRNSNTEKSKCYYIEKGFIPEMEKLLKRKGVRNRDAE